MERGPDDIFRVNNLSILKSPLPRHIFSKALPGSTVLPSTTGPNSSHRPSVPVTLIPPIPPPAKPRVSYATPTLASSISGRGSESLGGNAVLVDKLPSPLPLKLMGRTDNVESTGSSLADQASRTSDGTAMVGPKAIGSERIDGPDGQVGDKIGGVVPVSTGERLTHLSAESTENIFAVNSNNHASRPVSKIVGVGDGKVLTMRPSEDLGSFNSETVDEQIAEFISDAFSQRSLEASSTSATTQAVLNIFKVDHIPDSIGGGGDDDDEASTVVEPKTTKAAKTVVPSKKSSNVPKRPRGRPPKYPRPAGGSTNAANSAVQTVQPNVAPPSTKDAAEDALVDLQTMSIDERTSRGADEEATAAKENQIRTQDGSLPPISAGAEIQTGASGQAENPCSPVHEHDSALAVKALHCNADVSPKPEDDAPLSHNYRAASVEDEPAKAQTKNIIDDFEAIAKSAVQFTEWSFAPAPNNPKLTGVTKETSPTWIVLVGTRPDVNDLWHSSIVTERVGEKLVKTGSGKIYYLDSAVDETGMTDHGFSLEFSCRFRNGFPTNWKDLLIVELDRMQKSGTATGEPKATGGAHCKSNNNIKTSLTKPANAAANKRPVPSEGRRKSSGSSEETKKPAPAKRRNSTSSTAVATIAVTPSVSTPKTASQSIMPLATTRSGRRVIPPLAYWANQHIANFAVPSPIAMKRKWGGRP